MHIYTYMCTYKKKEAHIHTKQLVRNIDQVLLTTTTSFPELATKSLLTEHTHYPNRCKKLSPPLGHLTPKQ